MTMLLRSYTTGLEIRDDGRTITGLPHRTAHPCISMSAAGRTWRRWCVAHLLTTSSTRQRFR
jgi:hypothetical protein